MTLPSVNESSKVHKNLVRSQSFPLPNLDVNVMKEGSCNQSDNKNSGKWLIADDDNISSGVEQHSEINDKEDHGLMLCNMIAELEVGEKVNEIS
jgi:hypothetical protein